MKILLAFAAGIVCAGVASQLPAGWIGGSGAPDSKHQEARVKTQAANNPVRVIPIGRPSSAGPVRADAQDTNTGAASSRPAPAENRKAEAPREPVAVATPQPAPQASPPQPEPATVARKAAVPPKPAASDENPGTVTAATEDRQQPGTRKTRRERRAERREARRSAARERREAREAAREAQTSSRRARDPENALARSRPDMAGQRDTAVQVFEMGDGRRIMVYRAAPDENRRRSRRGRDRAERETVEVREFGFPGRSRFVFED